ncbi:MAG: F0F1 ATP synthase subunit B [Bacteroidales bacterium]|jgi:F-type H+-transporting ATPase subunit b|nr:F0F1 ATP synthase subunit B [Bacteroidales bacterium]
MELIKPSFGLIFWMLIGFGILFFILAKFAWPIITNGIASRNKKIADQLEEAAKIHEEMQSLNKKHDEMMAQAKNERDALLAEARKVSEEMYEKAKLKASAESQAMIEDAKKAIYFEKMKAITDAKNAIANFSIDIAQKVITEELKDREKQEALVEKWLEDCHFN